MGAEQWITISLAVALAIFLLAGIVMLVFVSLLLKKLYDSSKRLEYALSHIDETAAKIIRQTGSALAPAAIIGFIKKVWSK